MDNVQLMGGLRCSSTQEIPFAKFDDLLFLAGSGLCLVQG